MIAVIATQGQFEVAREVLSDPADPRYDWALRFMEVYGKSGRRARRAERGMFADATAGKKRDRARRAALARQLAKEGWTVNEIRVHVAVVEGRPREPFDRRTVQRWLRGGVTTKPR